MASWGVFCQSIPKGNELEFRIGRRVNGALHTTIAEDVFERLRKRLHAFPGWEGIQHSETECYRTGSIRMEEDDVGMRTVTEKVRLGTRDFEIPQTQWVVRIASSNEVVASPVAWKETFLKKRESFLRKGVRIDLTTLTSEDGDDEEPVKHLVEVEVLDPDAARDAREWERITWKVFDVLRCMEEPFPNHDVERAWFETSKPC